MNKEALKKNQPTVYRTLSNALKYNRLAHAYLFVGPKDANKRETAMLFSQSLICSFRDDDGFACQECESCKRLAKEESLDFHWVHGDKERIKKKDIVSLQDFFGNTSAQEENKRIYILEQFDQATVEASNSLLKFLEEPSKDIYAILTADEKANLLPTIQSRCQIVTFRPTSTLELQEILSKEMDIEDATMLAQNGYSYERAKELADSEDFKLIKESARKYCQNLDSLRRVFYLQTEVFIPKTDRMKKEWIQIFLEWMLYFIRRNEKYTMIQRVKVQEIIIESIDLLRRPVDLALFLDKIYNQVRKAVNE